MRHLFIMTCLTFATACAGPRAATFHTTGPASSEAEGMQLSHSEPDAPRCFTAHDHRLICPEGGAAIYSASDAQVQHTPATMELDPSCYGASATAQCAVQAPADTAPTVAEDNNPAAP